MKFKTTSPHHNIKQIEVTSLRYFSGHYILVILHYTSFEDYINVIQVIFEFVNHILTLTLLRDPVESLLCIFHTESKLYRKL